MQFRRFSFLSLSKASLIKQCKGLRWPVIVTLINPLSLKVFDGTTPVSDTLWDALIHGHASGMS